MANLLKLLMLAALLGGAFNAAGCGGRGSALTFDNSDAGHGD